MPLHVSYDVTRLVTRMFNVTPNGIDRVDAAFARHFLRSGAGGTGTVWTPAGPRLLPEAAARDAVAGIDVHWGEADSPGTDPAYTEIVAHLTGRVGLPATRASHIGQGRNGRAAGVLRWLRQHGLPIAQSPGRHLPDGACYLNVSQFPLWVPSYFRWLEGRPDVKAVFFIHDLLPLELPEYFPASEAPRHLRRLQNLARFGAGAIVTTETVRAALATHLARIGSSLPILVAPTPMSPVFAGPGEPDARLAGSAYFVCCSTIEPRKNHLLLLHVWRELVARLGAAAPRLVLVGKRGWQFGPVADLLSRAPAMRSHVLEVRGLTTPGLRRLLDGARALLMPTFGEGYGLPVHEALAAGVPAITSDIPVFAGIDSPLLTRLSPIDGEAWLQAIVRAASGSRPLTAGAGRIPLEWQTYFTDVEAFVDAL